MRCRFVPRPQWPMSILSSRTAGKPSLRGRFHLAQWTLSPECRKRSIRLNLAQCSALVVEKRQDQQQHGQHGDRDHTYTVPNFFAHPSYVPEWGDDSNARDGKPDRRLLCQENYGVWTGPPTLELKYGRQYRRNAALAGPIPRTLRPRSSHEGSGRLRRGPWCPGAGWPTPSTNLVISNTYRPVKFRLCTTILCQFNRAYSAIRPRAKQRAPSQ
jgi:hypothetical protein